MQEARIGVLGVGNMGYNHARVLSELAGVELVGVSDSRSETLDRVCAELGVRGYRAYGELLDQGLDGAVVAVPTSLHYEVGAALVDAGVPLLVEKPIARSSGRARALIQQAAERGVGLMVGHIERFNPVVVKLREMLNGDAVISLDITRAGPLPLRIGDMGVITDLGVHDADLISYLTSSEVATVHCCASRNVAAFEDMAVMTFSMVSGAIAHITTNWLTPFKVRKMEVVTRDCFIEADLLDLKITEFSRDAADPQEYTVRVPHVEHRDPLQEELKAFVKMVVDGADPAVSGADGLRALEIVEQCLEHAGL